MKKVYGVWAVRSAASVFGAAQAWCKSDGRPLEFDTLQEAEAYAKECNENISTSNVHYYAKEKEPEPNAAKMVDRFSVLLFFPFGTSNRYSIGIKTDRK